MKFHVKLLSILCLLTICFSMVTSISAARNSYFDVDSTSNSSTGISFIGTNAFDAYNPPAHVLQDDDTNFCMIAYPSSYWDGKNGANWEWRAYKVTWPHYVWIDSIDGMNYQDTTPVTLAHVIFNPKGTLEGELTVDWSEDGKHNGCDFSAITGFEKENSWTHLSIWKSRGSYPVAV
jgi:hypothetical protein